MYSSAFARLAETTQVVSPERGYVFHNRLTHSLKVGQIARRIAEHLCREFPGLVEKLGGLDADAAEAAGLAHDLGHPPFGHIAEEELSELAEPAGGYEGNPQAFRIVTRIASSDARDAQGNSIAGLNLTRQTLNGILKYPWARGENRQYLNKWGYYTSESEIFKWVREGFSRRHRCLIAEIMDWADDITFAIHDLVDFFRAGCIPVDRCKPPQSAERSRLQNGVFRRKPKWEASRKDYESALDNLLVQFPFKADRRYEDTESDRAKLYAFSSALIKYYVTGIELADASDQFPLLRVNEHAQREVEMLKQFTWEYVIEDPSLAVPQTGQRAAVRNVFNCLMDANKTNKLHLFPGPYMDLLAKARGRKVRTRLVADCVSGMTERQILGMHQCLLGLSGNYGQG